jgi:predicted amidophosphoribosyltransferase
MFLVDLLSGLLRPAGCLACGAPAGWPCCVRCLPPDPGDVGPWPLAAEPEVACWALGPYRDALRAAVLAGKLDGQPAALAELGRRLGVALAAAGIGADLVTWVAARRAAGQPRDHAERIAEGIATALDLPLVDLLAPAGGRDLGRARRAASRSAAHRRPARPRPPGAAWPAAGSCWSTTWPPPAAPSPAPPPPSARPAPARSRPPSWPRPRRPSWPRSRAGHDLGIGPAHRGRIAWL